MNAFLGAEPFPGMAAKTYITGYEQAFGFA
jgi:hypothetical protein